MFLSDSVINEAFLDNQPMLILRYLNNNRIRLDNEVASYLVCSSVENFSFHKETFLKIINAISQYKLDKEKIINTIMEYSEYPYLLSLEENKVISFTLEEKLSAIINPYGEVHDCNVFKEIVIKNIIDDNLKEKLFMVSVNKNSFKFTEIMIEVFGMPTKKLLKKILLETVYNDRYCIFEILYKHSESDFRTYVKLASDSTAFNILKYLYTTFPLSDKECIYFYNHFSKHNLSTPYISDFAKKITFDYNVAIIKNKILDF